MLCSSKWPHTSVCCWPLGKRCMVNRLSAAACRGLLISTIPGVLSILVLQRQFTPREISLSGQGFTVSQPVLHLAHGKIASCLLHASCRYFYFCFFTDWVMFPVVRTLWQLFLWNAFDICKGKQAYCSPKPAITPWAAGCQLPGQEWWAHEVQYAWVMINTQQRELPVLQMETHCVLGM